MGRGYLFGLLIGALASGLSLAVASLMVPPVVAPTMEPVSTTDPGTAQPAADATDVGASEAVEEAADTEATTAEATTTEPVTPGAGMPETEAPEAVATETATPEADDMAAAEPEVAAPAPEADAMAGTDVSTEVAPAAEPAELPQETAAATPEAPVVEVPAGSEFARAKSDTEAVVPAPEAAPAITAAPAVAPPDAEAAPELADVSPAAVPEGKSDAPSAPEAPDTPQPLSIAEVPAAESSIPVPPPGETSVPVLGTDTTPDAAPDTPAPAPMPEIVTAEATPEPEPVTEPAAEPAPEVAPAAPATEAAPLPAATPEPVTPEPAPAAEPAPVPEPPAATLDESEPSEDLPPDGSEPESSGPKIIDIAPRAPIGAAGAPQPGFNQSVPGVKVNRLPTIGDGASPTEGESAGGEPAVPEIVLDTPETPQGPTALARFAAPFDNPESKPLLAVVLEDIGEENGGVGPDALAAIGRPITIAIDPERPDAAARAAVYRLAGHEVAILAPLMPEGATAADLEVSYQSYVQTLPEAVALIGAPGAAFQTDRRVAQHLVALLASEGRGLVSYSRGLNPARQAATGAGLPNADVYRELDGSGESAATLARYLDRAAFEAARQNQVVVAGTSSAETVSALEDWIAAGAKGTIIGPVSAVMLGEN